MKRFTVLLVSVAAALPLAAQPFGASTSQLRVNTYTSGGDDHPAVAYVEGSGFVVAWDGNEPEDPGYGVYARRYGTAQAVGSQFRVNTFAEYSQGAPRVGGAPPGNASANQFVIVWNSQLEDGSDTGVFGQRYGSSGPLGAEFQVNTYTTYGEESAAVSLDASGDFVVVWEQPDPDLRGIFGRRFAANGDAQGGAFRVNVFTTGEQYRAWVARSSTGEFVVVWESQQEFGPSKDIVGRRFSSAGAPLTDDFLISSTTSTNHVLPSVADLGLHGFVAAWESDPGSGVNQIFARRFDVAGAPTAAAFRVSTSTTTNHFAPSVSGGSDGSFTVVWETETLNDPSIYGQRYSASGSPVGGEFPVNTYTTGSHRSPRVAMAGGGTFTVTWRSSSPDTGYNIVARTFCGLQGDANGDGVIDVADVFYVINDLFAGGPVPVHPSDANGDGHTDVADVFYLINALFAGGPAPACVPAG